MGEVPEEIAQRVVGGIDEHNMLSGQYAVSTMLYRIRGQSRSIRRQTRSCGSIRTSRLGISSRRAGLRATAAEREYVDHRVVFRTLLRSHQRRRDRLGIRKSILW